jgi:hypothetical protein
MQDACSSGYTMGVIVEHLRDGQLDYELDKCDELREPPLPVTAWLLLDSTAHDGLLYGWAANPKRQQRRLARTGRRRA